MAKHRLRVNLFDPQSLSDAVRRLEGIRDNILRNSTDLLNQLADIGAQNARNMVVAYDAIETATLYNSIYPVGATEGERISKVVADTPYAAYVEYGTGIVGSANKHPAPDGWDYDVNGHGDAGWWYYDWAYSNWRWTKGQPAKPFMYETKLYLERLAPKVAANLYKKL